MRSTTANESLEEVRQFVERHRYFKRKFSFPKKLSSRGFQHSIVLHVPSLSPRLLGDLSVAVCSGHTWAEAYKKAYDKIREGVVTECTRRLSQ